MPGGKFQDFVGAGKKAARTAGSKAAKVGIGVREQVQAAASNVQTALDNLTNPFGNLPSSPVDPRASKIDEALRQWKPGQVDLTPEGRSEVTSNLAPNQNTASNSNQPGQQIFRPDVNTGLLFGNPLNDYVNVQYHVLLSVVPETALSKIQPDIISQGASCARFYDEMRQSTRRDGSVTIASTGEAFRNQEAMIFERETQTIDATEEQRTRASRQIDALNARFDELKSQQAEVERRNPGTVTGTSPLIAQQWAVRRAIQAVKDGLPVPREVEVILPPELRGVERNYYNITNISMTNMMAPSKQNPMFSNLIAFKMTLAEPHGFRLHDDIRTLGKRLGYDGIHYHRMVYRVDIFFSGWNQDTGEYIPIIPITVKTTEQEGCSNGIVSYYMNITDMQAKTTHTGTEYSIDFVPLGALALRPEEVNMEATSIILGKDPTFADFLSNLATELGKAKKSQSKADTAPEGTGVERIYEFIAPKDLLQARYNERNVQGTSTETGHTENPEDGFSFKFRQGTTIINALRRGMEDLPAAQERFLVDGADNEDFSKPRVRYSIRLNSVYEQKNPQINDYKRIRFQYIIEPHYTFKEFNVTSHEQSLKALSLQARLRRLKEMLRLGMVQRKYSYLFTGENVEVMDLELKFSMFYFRTLSQDDTNSKTHAATATVNESATKADEKDGVIEGKKEGQDTDSPTLQAIKEADLRRRLESNVEASLKRLFGVVPSATIREGAVGLELLNQALVPTGKKVIGEASNRTDTADERKNLYLRSVQNNLESDLLEIDLKVRGDPIYLFSPYGTQSLNILDPLDSIRYDNSNSEGNQDVDKFAVQPSTDKVFFLDVQAPNQADYMNPNRREGSSNDSIIGGFYQILEVQSELQGGLFTQTIKGMKIPNLNYLAENITLFAPTPLPGANEASVDQATQASAVSDQTQEERSQ